MRATVFTPDDLYLLKGPPSRRRAFLDNLLKQVSSDYKKYHEDYERLLNRRNNLLKSELKDRAMMEALDHVFASTAAQIVLARLNILKILEKF